VRAVAAVDSLTCMCWLGTATVTTQYEVLVPDKQRSQQTVLSAMTWLCDTVQRKPFTVLSGVQARLRPGTLTLLLGGPSSGKSSLLQAIAGQLRPTPGATLQGTVTYNGQPATSLPMQRVVGLVQQYDNHLAHMTVRETLTFAYACQTGAGRQLPGLCRDVRLTSAQQAEVCAISAKRVDAVMEVLDLLHVADTLLGDDMTRGVSGGQRKRVTIGEFLVGNHKALLLDEMSNGLDSSKTLDIVRYLRRTARTMQITMMATLLQPAREVAAVFHESMLMYRGRVFYYGPWDTVESYFGNMGYHCPDARDFCDFLLDIATTAGRKDAGSDDSFDGLTTKWLAYEKTAAAAAGHTDVAVLDAAPLRCGGAYTVSLSTALGQVIGRDVRVMRTNPIDVVRRNVQCLIMGVICGTLFWNISKSDVMQQGSRFGSFFLVGIILLPGQIPAVPLIVNRAATFYK
jgi:ABC-type multidrug transport system ATPase subunit